MILKDKNNLGQGIKRCDISRQVRLGTARKKSLIASTMEYKAAALPTEHHNVRAEHFEGACLLLPKINAQ